MRLKTKDRARRKFVDTCGRARICGWQIFVQKSWNYRNNSSSRLCL